MVVLKSPTNRRPRMASIETATQAIKDNPLSFLNRIDIPGICEQCNHDWRDRELDPATTLACFMQQVLHGNASCNEVRHIAKKTLDSTLEFSGQAYCEARARLPLAVYRAVLKKVYDDLVPITQRTEHRWHGHRTFHIDGSSFSMPDTPQLRQVFGTPSGQAQGCGFPTGHLLVLFSASTGLLMEAWASHLNRGDLAGTPGAHAHLQPGDIVIGDDSYSGFAHLALLQTQGLHGLFPVHHRRIVDFTTGRSHNAPGHKHAAGRPSSRWIRWLGPRDQLVEYFKDIKPQWMSDEQYAALPESMLVREIRRTVTRPGLGTITITFVTTLLDPVAYPADELMELRLRRWDVETNIGHLKTTMGMDVLRCKSEAGVLKELAVFCIVYNLVRGVTLQAAARQEVAVSRISFADAYHWMRHARPGDVLPALIVNPYRPNRFEPRCKKRRAKQYDLMNKPRDVLRKLLKNKRKTG
jgi:hypothetical protein